LGTTAILQNPLGELSAKENLKAMDTFGVSRQGTGDTLRVTTGELKFASSMGL